MSHQRLTIGLLLDSHHVPAWAYRALELAISRGDIQIDALVINTGSKANTEANWLHRLHHDFFWFLFSRLDAWVTSILPSRVSDPRGPMDIRQLAPQARLIEVMPRMVRSSDYFVESDILQIEQLNLDVLFRIGFRIIRGGILTRGAKFGIWSFHHGDIRSHRGQPSGFWEFTNGEPSVGAVLQVLTEDLDGGLILARASGPARNAITWGSILNRLYWLAGEMLPKTLHLIAHGGEAAFASMLSQQAKPISVHDRPLRLKPGNGPSLRAMLRILHRLGLVLVKRVVTRPLEWVGLLRATQWGILVGSIEQVGAHGFSLNLRKQTLLKSPNGNSWADPFIVHHDGKAFIFVEEFSRGNTPGFIAWLELDDRREVRAKGTALVEPFHLSFPEIFRHNGDYYMIPEARAANQIRLYRCTSFPSRWEFHSVLIDQISAADSTMAYYEDRWWLFTCSSTGNASADHGLFIFHAPTPFGPWSPHLANPVTQEVDTSRPAGKIFEANGRLVRPAQIATEYGWGIALLEITKLTPSEFQEQKLDRIEPLWSKGVFGIHTLNISQSMVVTDCKLLPEWRK